MDHIEAESFHLVGQSKFAKMKSAGSYFQSGDVLYGRLRPYLNKVHRAKFEGVASAEFIVLPASEFYDSDFVKYLLHQRIFVDFAMSRSSGDRPRVKFDGISDFEFLLPPLNEQRRIVEKIETLFARLDKGEEALREVQKLLARYRQSVLKAAVTGELTADWRAENAHRLEHGRDLLARILKTRRETWQGRGKYKEPAPLKTKGLPQLPESWAWVRVDTAGDVLLGRQRAPQYHAGELMRPYLRVANVFEDRLDLSDVKRMNFDEAHFEKYKLEPGDILLNEGQTPDLVGRPAMFRGEIPDCCFQKTLHRFRPSKWVHGEFALAVFRSYMHNRRFKKAASITTNIAHLTLSKFVEIEFPVPPIEEQEETVSRLSAELSRIEKVEYFCMSEGVRSTALRQSILRDAFSGRLVRQDPTDEPATELIARIKAAGSAACKKSSRKAPAKVAS
jgi:type I restriction enzyme S subunit